MSLLEDARAISESAPSSDDQCPHCSAYIGPVRGGDYGEHSPDCPWLAMPRIVAALEAAEKVASDMPLDEGHAECYYCGGWRDHHAAGCPWQALAAALRGAEMTPDA